MEDLFIKITGNVVQAVNSQYDSFTEQAPYVLGSLAVFLFGWILAEITSRAIIGMSKKLKLELISDKVGLSHLLKKWGTKSKPTRVIAKSMKGYLMFLFLIEATKIAGLTQVADFLGTVIGYVPEVIIAIIIMIVGIRIGNTLELVISTSLNFAKSSTADILGIAAKYMIVTFAILAALSQLQIAEILINTLFIGFVAMISLAGALAIGLGGKDVVKELLEAIKKVEVKEIKKEIREIEKEKK